MTRLVLSQGIDFVAFRRPAKFELTGVVNASAAEWIDTLEVQHTTAVASLLACAPCSTASVGVWAALACPSA